MFCHLSVICVVNNDLKIVSRHKIELTREDLCAMIYYDFRRGLSRQECIDQLIFTFGDEAPSYATVKRWYSEFNRGRYSLTDEFRKDRPKSVVGPENINPVQKLIIQDCHVTYCEIELILSISSTSIYKILHEHLAVEKICSHWIPHNLPKAQKVARVDWCKQILKRCSNACKKCINYRGEYFEKQ